MWWQVVAGREHGVHVSFPDHHPQITARILAADGIVVSPRCDVLRASLRQRKTTSTDFWPHCATTESPDRSGDAGSPQGRSCAVMVKGEIEGWRQKTMGASFSA